MAVHLSALTVYPVKSCRGLALSEAEVRASGLAGDREWMILDAAGKVLTARTRPTLLGVTAIPGADGSLTLSAADRPPLEVAMPRGGSPVPVVGMSGMDRALPAGPAADDWVTAFLGEPARLVRLDEEAPRTLAAKHGGRPGDAFNLSDAGPLLLATSASLRQLDEWLAEGAAETDPGRPEPASIAMARFRPNVVVDGASPFAEDDWRDIRIGEVGFRFGERCDRCVMTTIDPDTLARGKEPVRTLAAHRRADGNVWFGIRLIPTTAGSIRVGDEVHAS